MGLNSVTSGERIHIAFFGKRNTGKSSLVNAVTGQSLCVVSAIKGTTTDPVKKSMELLPLGPVVIIDTPGIDDEGELGRLRVQKTEEILSRTDIAVLVAVASQKLGKTEHRLIEIFNEKKLPYIVAYNKCDLQTNVIPTADNEILVSAKKKINIETLKKTLGSFTQRFQSQKPLVSDLLKPQDLAVLVIPIDEAAPKGRLILPQQMVIRDILENGCIAVISREHELSQTLATLSRKPDIVITDSQIFTQIARIIPEDIPLTSFSILMARYKGELSSLIAGAAVLKHLKDKDKILICEGCTHQRRCKDIGTVKIPAWIENFSGSKPDYSFTSGGDFPDNLLPYKVIVHCGGCMLTEKEMKRRIEHSAAAKIPLVNYGIAIALMHGVLKRSLNLFPETAALLEEKIFISR